METTDVIICGAGPTGAMLSAYLGQQSVTNVVLEKELDITQDPRGIALDEDGIRFLQVAGVYDKVFTEMGRSEYTRRIAPEWKLMFNIRHGLLQIHIRRW